MTVRRVHHGKVISATHASGHAEDHPTRSRVAQQPLSSLRWALPSAPFPPDVPLLTLHDPPLRCHPRDRELV